MVRFGMFWRPLGDHDPGWFLRWFGFAGVGLFGMTFLVGSIIARRNPRNAGIIFLVFLPFSAFCLAYPESGFLVWHADGGGWFETPLPLTAIGLAALFFVPFIAPLLTLHHKKWAVTVFAVTSIVAVIVFAHSRWTTVMVPRLAGYSAPFLVFGLFWLGTKKLGWPSLAQPRPRPVAKRVAGLAITCLAVLCLDVVLTIGFSTLGSSLLSADCGQKRPFTHPLSPRHTVFTARVIYVGLSVHTWLQIRSNPNALHDDPIGEWAIGVVQERFWGVPSWEPHLVLLTNFIYRRGETYFIDGTRENGLLTGLLPIVDAQIGCSRSRLAQDAGVDLRLLREAR